MKYKDVKLKFGNSRFEVFFREEPYETFCVIRAHNPKLGIYSGCSILRDPVEYNETYGRSIALRRAFDAMATGFFCEYDVEISVDDFVKISWQIFMRLYYNAILKHQYEEEVAYAFRSTEKERIDNPGFKAPAVPSPKYQELIQEDDDVMSFVKVEAIFYGSKLAEELLTKKELKGISPVYSAYSEHQKDILRMFGVTETYWSNHVQ